MAAVTAATSAAGFWRSTHRPHDVVALSKAVVAFASCSFLSCRCLLVDLAMDFDDNYISS